MSSTARKASFARSNELRARAHRVIPGGAHTYAKGDDQYPVLAPGFIDRGSGCLVWDVDGNKYIEYGMGLRAVTLGHANPVVDKAVMEAVSRGLNFTRPSAFEVEVAEEVLGFLAPSGDRMIKFGKNGSDATSAAVRLARAVTGRDKVALADQPFFSVDDWFIGATDMSDGVPRVVRELSLVFHYGSLESLRRLFDAHPRQIAAVVLEAARNDAPPSGFLEGVQRLCRENGTLLILDEMITGFRWHPQGAAAYYGLDPDLATFGKAMGNGYSVSALIGRREIMERGGLRTNQARVFLLSLTHGAETTGLAAARAVVRLYREAEVIPHLWHMGQRLLDGLHEISASHGLSAQVEPLGMPCNLVFTTRDADGNPSQPLRALLLQELISRGVLAPSLVVSYAHTERVIEQTLAAFDQALAVYREALENGVDRYLIGRPVQPVFRRFVGDV